MLQIFIKIITSFINPIIGYLIIKKFRTDKFLIKKTKLLIFILILAFINILVYNVEYNMVISLMNFLASILIYKILFDLTFFESILSVCILFVLLTLGDALTSIIMISFVDAVTVRQNTLQMFTSNCIVAAITYFISNINFVKNNISRFIETAENNKKFKTITFFVLTLILVLVFIYIISTNYQLIKTYYFSIIIVAILVILFLIFIKENNSRVQFENKYLELIEYSKTFEDMIDNDRLLIHEHKNELAVIKSLNNIKEVRKYIDSILDYESGLKTMYIEDLKVLPKGGLKGLIYYKLIVATNKKLNITVSISKNIKDIAKINNLYLKQVMQILGICLDNAIEASVDSVEKELSIEIYKMRDKLNIVICNSFDQNKVDLSRINNKGYSTKGKFRGNGLYYLNKIIESQNLIKADWKIINKYFIRTISIIIK